MNPTVIHPNDWTPIAQDLYFGKGPETGKAAMITYIDELVVSFTKIASINGPTTPPKMHTITRAEWETQQPHQVAYAIRYQR